MHRLFALTVVFTLFVPRAQAYVDVSSSLGDIIKDSTTIAVLRVAKVSQEKRAIIFKKVADLKGRSPDDIRHEVAAGFHPREPKLVLDWAEPGKLAVCFTSGNASLTCIGTYWYECGALEAPWWTMTTGRAELGLAYFGSAEKLRDAIPPILEGKEVVITAINHGPQSGVFQYSKVAYQKVLRGKDCPVWRLRASLEMPSIAWTIGVRDSRWVVGLGAAGPEDVPGLVRELSDNDRQVRARAADDLGLVGWAAHTALPTLRKAFEDADPLVRISAARAVLLIGDDGPQALRVLQEALTHRETSVRKAAAVAIGDLGTSAAPAVARLCDALRDSDKDVRWAVAESLGRIGPDAEAAVPDLAHALRDPAVRIMAADALGGIGRAARGAVPLLTDALKDKDADFRWTAAVALTRIDARSAKAALPLFIEKLKSDDRRVRWDALMYITPMGAEAKDAAPEVRALVKRGNGIAAATLAALVGPEAEESLPILLYVLDDDWDTCEDIAKIGPAGVPGLIEILNNPAATNRHLAVKGLGLLAPRSPRAVAALLKALRDNNPVIRKAAAVALAGVEPRPKEAVAALVQALKDDAPAVRLAAALALRSCGEQESAAAVQTLVELLAHKESNVRREAAAALAEFGMAAKSATLALQAAQKDSDASVRSAAAWATARVGTAESNHQAVATLMTALKDTDPRARQEAARLLGKVGPDARAAVAALSQARLDDNEDVRRAATEALTRIQVR